KGLSLRCGGGPSSALPSVSSCSRPSWCSVVRAESVRIVRITHRTTQTISGPTRSDFAANLTEWTRQPHDRDTWLHRAAGRDGGRLCLRPAAAAVGPAATRVDPAREAGGPPGPPGVPHGR